MIQTMERNDTDLYARCVEASKRVRWDIDQDVFRGRKFDFSKKFLPDGISKIHQLDFLNEEERRVLSQIQGRTYANIFGLVERFIAAKVLEVSQHHWLGDQTALEALVRFSDEELKHQELFRRVNQMIADGMPEGYSFPHDPNTVASVVLSKSTWAVLGLTCLIELFTQAHYKQSIEPDENASALFRDIFRYHWMEESQHAKLDELEWIREDDKLAPKERDRAVEELIELAVAVDQILQVQAEADSEYFLKICGRSLIAEETARIHALVLQAYRWQYILSGVEHPHFLKVLGGMITETHRHRINTALAPLM